MRKDTSLYKYVRHFKKNWFEYRNVLFLDICNTYYMTLINSTNVMSRSFSKGIRGVRALFLLPLLLIQLVSLQALAQKRISGVVTDEAGSPLEGVTVVLRGTSNATTTDNVGRFSVTA